MEKYLSGLTEMEMFCKIVFGNDKKNQIESNMRSPNPFGNFLLSDIGSSTLGTPTVVFYLLYVTETKLFCFQL